MSRGGPKPKPAALKVIEGNRGHRPIPTEPEFGKGVPEKPSGLLPEAAALWDIVAPELDALGLFARVDAAALEAACSAYAQARMADRLFERKMKVASGTGKAAKDALIPMIRASNASRMAWAQYRAFCTQFGLTPSSRVQLDVGDTGRKIDLLEEALG